MSASDITALLVFCTAMSFSPGPDTTLSTALAANHGLRRALRLCLAAPTGWTLLIPPGQRLVIICAVMVLFAFTRSFTYALAGSLLRGWLAQGTRLRWFNRLLAVVLVLTAAWVMTV